MGTGRLTPGWQLEIVPAWLPRLRFPVRKANRFRNSEHKGPVEPPGKQRGKYRKPAKPPPYCVNLTVSLVLSSHTGSMKQPSQEGYGNSRVCSLLFRSEGGLGHFPCRVPGAGESGRERPQLTWKVISRLT